MNVVYASNDRYARHLAVSMVSLFEKNQNVGRIVVYVISMGITVKSRGLLRALAGKYGRDLHFIELDRIREQFDFSVDTHGFDISTMGRLFVGRLLPDKVRRVLYLDCDTVVVQSLGALWNTDLQGKVLGAVMEPTIYQKAKREVGLGDKDAYVNAGVLLMDLKQWREFRAEERILDLYRKKGGHLFACDQDLINGVLKGQIYFLPPRYNFFPNYRYFSYEELLWYSRTYEAVTREEYEKAKRHPAIIHYAGDERPWIAGNMNHYRRAYDKYLAMTPWAGTPKEEGKRLYMLAYHGMDYATAVCPRIRRSISRNFGMKVVEARRPAGTETKQKNSKSADREAKQEEESHPRGEERIQVLLAAYEGEAYLEEQLDSILAQTVSDVQIVVSDDGSEDHTRDILERYEEANPGRILLRHRIKEGDFADKGTLVPAPAMNFFWLLSQAEGDYILLSDQDDVWHPRKIEILLAKMKESEKKNAGDRGDKIRPVLVYSDMEVVDAQKKQISPSFCAYTHSNPGRVSFSEILTENPVTGGALMMNRPMLELVREVPEACFMHDWWIALCASCFGIISYVPQSLSQYRQHGGNVLGAAKTGSPEDLYKRLKGRKRVEENYRRMFRQAEAFGKRFEPRMNPSQRRALQAFLALPSQTVWRRLKTVKENRLFKSSRLQTLAQCFTIVS